MASSFMELELLHQTAAYKFYTSKNIYLIAFTFYCCIPYHDRVISQDRQRERRLPIEVFDKGKVHLQL